MEFTFLASYIVMLAGFLIMENPDRQNFVRQFLKGNNFADMVELLKKFFNFMNLTASVSVCDFFHTSRLERLEIKVGTLKFDVNVVNYFQTEASSVCAIKDTEKVIKFLEECDKPEQPQSSEKPAFSESMGMDLSFRLTP